MNITAAGSTRPQPRGALPSLRSRLLLLSVALLLPALAVAAVTLYAGSRHARQEVEKHLQETTRALSLVVDRQFGQAEALLWSLSVSHLLRARDYPAFDAQARDAVRLPGAWVVVEEPGRQVVNTRLAPGSALPEVANQDHWRGLEPGSVRVSNLFRGIVAQSPTVSVETVIRDPDGGLRQIAIIMPAERVSQALADQRLPPPWVGAILDRNATLVARSRDAARFVGRPATPDNVARVRAGVAEGVFESVSLDGIPTVIGYARSPASGWTTLVAVPQSELGAGTRQLALYLAAAGGLLIALGAALALWVARRITRPVAALLAEAEALGRDAPVAEPATEPGPEFRETASLRRAFAEARAALRQRQAERDAADAALKSANATLESRVAERTQELGVANASLQESQAVLAEREALYASVFRFNADGLFVIRVAPEGGLFVETYNPAVEILMGKPAREAAGLPLEDVVPADFYPLIEARIRECIARAEPIAYERRHAFAARGGLWAVTLVPIRDAAGRIVRVLGSNRDITREREAEAAIRESRDRYSALFEHSPLDLAVIEVRPDGSLVYEEANPALLRSLGFARDAFVGRTPAEVFPATAAEITARYRECVETRSLVAYEVAGPTPVGEVVRRTVLVPLLDEEGRVRKIFVTSMDLTEQRRMEERLRQAQRLESVGQLTGGIAHDFNNLLTVVMGNLDMLRRAKPERAPRLIDNALAAVEQGRRLTSQLLAFSRRQPLRPEVVEIGALVSGMRDMLAQSLRGDIALGIDIPGELWPVEVDPTQLQAALINLAANARDAMPKGGVLRIHAQNRPAQDGADRDGVAIQVGDTGIGIAPEDLTRVFEPFFTTKPVGEGTGLGLAQVYGFVQQSGGFADIASEPGRGTTVTLVLPRAARAGAQAPARVIPAASGAAARALRILLVEDNLQVAELATAVLSEQGHRVEWTGSAPQALAKLEADPAFDLVFSDLVMPGGLDGLALAKQIRRRWPGLPVLLATGYSAEAPRAQGEGFRLLPKPYAPGTLLDAIAELAGSDSPAADAAARRPAQA